jgi:integrase
VLRTRSWPAWSPSTAARESPPRRRSASSSSGASPTTVENYRSKARHLTRLAGVRLDRLTGQTLDDFYRDLQANGVHAPTVRECHALIRATLNQGIRWGWCDRNVAMMAPPPRAQRKEVQVPTVAGALAAFEDAESTNPEMAAFLRLAAATGAQRGELCALRWTDVDLDAGMLHIQRSIAQVGQQTFEKSTKTHQSRLVPIGPGTVSRLVTHRAAMVQRADMCEVVYLADAFPFSSEPDGSAPWFPKRTTLAWIRLRARHGLDGVKLHALRHLAVSAMLDAGVPVRDVADMVGHLDTRTTSISTHGNEKRRREAAMVPGAGRLGLADDRAKRHAALGLSASSEGLGFGGRSARLKSRDCAENPFDLKVLGLHVLLNRERRVQHGVCVLVCRLGSCISGGRLDVLTDDDDREQNELKERLGCPRHCRGHPAVDRGGQADQCQTCEGICAPHRADHRCDLQSEKGIEPIR